MHPSGQESIHLTYCSNIHPGESWEDVFDQLDQHVPELKRELSRDAPFGIGLRVGHEAAQTLVQPDAMGAFQNWLSQQNCYVFTINGFPYGSFHGGVVKDDVYQPDWRSRERIEYTKTLIQILAELLPKDTEGSISTSPISYKPWLSSREADAALRIGAIHFAEITGLLVRLHNETGIFIHMGIEPEPDCLIENTAETVDFYQQWLFEEGAKALAADLGCGNDRAVEHLREHVRVCYDTCHFAVEYEEPSATFEAFEKARIKLSKIQLSAAIKMNLGDHRPEDVEQALRPFAESTYLHQVIEQLPTGELTHYPDLPDALDQLTTTTGREWRIHYHVPLFVESYGSLKSTQSELKSSLKEALTRDLCAHYELETYTWEVLPDDLQKDLGQSIQREFEWTLAQFNQT